MTYVFIMDDVWSTNKEVLVETMGLVEGFAKPSAIVRTVIRAMAPLPCLPLHADLI